MKTGHVFRKLLADDSAIGTHCPLCSRPVEAGDEVDTVGVNTVHRSCVEEFLKRAQAYEEQSCDLQTESSPTEYDQVTDFLYWLGEYEDSEYQNGYGALGLPKPTTLEELDDLERQFERWQTTIGIKP